MRGASVAVTRSKSILNKCPLGFADWTLNPYLGCAFGCSYCYVPMMNARRGVELPGPWGSYVRAKTNAAELLRAEMRKVKPGERIAIGTATDPYQPLEGRLGITRSILEQLCFYDNRVSITTRSPLVLRDLDVLSRLASPSVNMSMPSVDDAVRRAFEPNSPAIPGRLEAVRRLKEAGIHVDILWMPLLPGVSDTRASIERCMTVFATVGVPVFAAGMRGLGTFAETFNEAKRRLDRERGPDSTRLKGAEIGNAILEYGSAMGVTVHVDDALLGDSRPNRRVPDRNHRDLRKRLVV